jgi:hypothetical protein
MPRAGWLHGPVRPESAALPESRDVLGLGRLSMPLQWPATRRLLMRVFALTPAQAWSVAARVRTQAHLSPQRWRLRLRAGLLALVLLLPLLIFVPIAHEAYFEAVLRRAAERGSTLGLDLAIGAGAGALAVVVWLLYERFGEDRLMERAIRASWRDQVCLWCRHDLEGVPAEGDRWGVCPECGMRSPVAARSP